MDPIFNVKPSVSAAPPAAGRQAGMRALVVPGRYLQNIYALHCFVKLLTRWRRSRRKIRAFQPQDRRAAFPPRAHRPVTPKTATQDVGNQQNHIFI
jgi:hypothetical protein